MRHEDAAHSSAVERYVTGAMRLNEMEEFERHFFDCAECLHQLKQFEIVESNARAVILEEPAETIVTVEKIVAVEKTVEAPRAPSRTWLWLAIGLIAGLALGFALKFFF